MNKKRELSEKLAGLFPLLDQLLIKPFENAARRTVSGTQLRVLFILDRSVKTTMSELAKKMEISKQQITAVIDGLVRLEFVERIFNPMDRRTIEIKLAPKALAFLEELKEKMAEIYSCYYERLQPEEIQRLYDGVKEVEGLMHKMLQN